MKKVKIVQIIGIILFVIYVALIISELSFGYLGELQNLVFSVILAMVSLTLIYKGVLLKSGSTLWFAITLILYAILMIIFELLKVNVNDFYYVFVLIPIIASLINIVVFNNLMYIKVIILNISLAIPVFLISFVEIDWWLTLILVAMCLFAGIVICRLINFDKEKV